MKKQILLAAALCGIAFGSADAQLQTTKNESAVGMKGAEELENGNKRLSITFNTNKGYTNGSEGSNKINCNNLKGVLGVAFTTEGIDKNVATKLDTYHYTANTSSGVKFKRYKDVASLIKAHTVEGSIVNPAHRYWRFGNILMDVPGTEAKDQAWAVWPGINKRTALFITFKGDDGMANLCKDIELDLMTLDKGTTGKTSAYKMVVLVGESSFGMGEMMKKLGKGAAGDDVAFLDSINEKNVAAINEQFGGKYTWFAKDSIYITSADSGVVNKKTIKVAETVGATIKDFRGKKLSIILYATTSGTPVQPGMYEPLLGVDNLFAEYSEVKWIEPDVVENTKDTVKITDAVAGEDNAIKFILKTQNRLADLVITPDGDNKMATSFKMTPKEENCCIMAYNEATQKYDMPVDYQFTAADAVAGTPYSIKIPASADGTAINDDIEVTLIATSRRPATGVFYRLEITNGKRIWKDFIVDFNKPVTASAPDANQVTVNVEKGKVVVKNATDSVVVTNAAGMVLTQVSAEEAAMGIALPQGVCIVKTGDFVQKVLVE